MSQTIVQMDVIDMLRSYLSEFSKDMGEFIKFEEFTQKVYLKISRAKKFQNSDISFEIPNVDFNKQISKKDYFSFNRKMSVISAIAYADYFQKRLLFLLKLSKKRCLSKAEYFSLYFKSQNNSKTAFYTLNKKIIENQKERFNKIYFKLIRLRNLLAHRAGKVSDEDLTNKAKRTASFSWFRFNLYSDGALIKKISSINKTSSISLKKRKITRCINHGKIIPINHRDCIDIVLTIYYANYYFALQVENKIKSKSH